MGLYYNGAGNQRVVAMLHVFIVNPKAGRNRPADRIAALEQAARDHRLDYRIVVTEAPGHATALARRAIAESAGAVVAVGGDGTVNEVLNGLDNKTSLGIVATGTCNDIARNLGLPERDCHVAADVIAAGHVVRVDAGRCGERRFLSVAGMGLDSRVALSFKRLPRFLRRRAAYVLLLFKNLLARRPSLFRITADGETIEQKAWMVAVANTEAYGGGMRIAPRAKATDGLLHMCIVGDGPRREIIRSFPLVWRGEHLTHPIVRTFEVRKIQVSSDVPTPVIADGEHIGWLPVAIAVEPRSVPVFVAQNFDGGKIIR